MARQKRYSRAFKLDVLERLRTSGKTQREIEEELGLFEGQINYWKRQVSRHGERAFPGSGNARANEAEPTPLERRVADLERECEILKQALRIMSRDPR